MTSIAVFLIVVVLIIVIAFALSKRGAGVDAPHHTSQQDFDEASRIGRDEAERARIQQEFKNRRNKRRG